MTLASSGGPTLVILAAGQAKRYGGVKPLAPVGLGGEAVIDLLASDALAAGFGRLVLVVSPGTGPAIRYHVRRTWPREVEVHFAVQEAPRGTVDAVLSARRQFRAGESFGVANADDLYGIAGLALLAGAVLRGGNSIVCYRLCDTLIGNSPVTRGVCHVDAERRLVGVDERRKVTPSSDDRIEAHDGKEPVVLDGGAWVSVNLWAFAPAMLDVFAGAMDRSPDDEVLLPEVVADVVTAKRGLVGDDATVQVLEAQGRCIGVTHPADLALVQADIAVAVGRGERSAQLWTQLRPVA